MAALERAVELDSVNITWGPQLAQTHGRLRRYDDSQRTWTRYLRFWPEDYGSMIIKEHAAIRWNGSPDTLAAMLARIPPDYDQGGMKTYSHVQVARVRRRWSDVLPRSTARATPSARRVHVRAARAAARRCVAGAERPGTRTRGLRQRARPGHGHAGRPAR